MTGNRQAWSSKRDSFLRMRTGRYLLSDVWIARLVEYRFASATKGSVQRMKFAGRCDGQAQNMQVASAVAKRCELGALVLSKTLDHLDYFTR